MTDTVSLVNTNEIHSDSTNTSTSNSTSISTDTTAIPVAEIQSASLIARTELETASQIQIAQIGVNNQVEVAQIEADSRVAVANITSNATITSANVDAASRVEVAQTNLSASNYQADQQLAGVTLHEQAENARLQVKLAFAQSMFNQSTNLVSGLVSGSGSGSGSGGSAGFHASASPGPGGSVNSPIMSSGDFVVGGNDGFGYYDRRECSPRATKSQSPVGFHGLVDSLRMGGGDVKTGGIGFATGASVADAVAATNLPFISTSGVLTPAQIQQQANSAISRSDARTQSEYRRLVGDMVGRGFSAASPILAALQVGLAGQGLRAGIAGETQIRLESAKLNADAVFAGQKAVSDQYIQQEQVLLDDEKTQVTRTVGILNAVAQMVSSAL